MYYEGHAAYWYGDRWYYRSGREWYEYREEPRYLRDYREHHAHERRFYGRSHDRWEREDDIAFVATMTRIAARTSHRLSSRP